MACSVTFTCDACGATAQGIPGDYTHPDPPRGWVWFWGSELRMTGPHACSVVCWSMVDTSPDGKAYLPESHERRALAAEEQQEARALVRANSKWLEELPPRLVRDTQGTGQRVVYFIQRGSDGPVKIGFSKNPKGRLASLQTGIPERLHMLATVPGGKEEEQRLHRRFGPHCIQGEWFHPAPELMAYIGEHGRAA